MLDLVYTDSIYKRFPKISQVVKRGKLTYCLQNEKYSNTISPVSSANFYNNHTAYTLYQQTRPNFWSMSFFCATYNNFVKVSGALEFQHLTASFSKPAMHEVFIISPRILLKRRIKYIYFLIERHKTLDFFLPHSLSKTSTFQAITLKTITKTYWQFRYLKRQSVAPECMHGVSRVVGWCIT